MKKKKELRDDGFTVEEFELFDACRRRSQPSGMEPGKQASQLLDLLNEVYWRGHSSKASQTRKSVYVTRVIRLLESPVLFPRRGHYLTQRVQLLSDILKDSRQRPVMEQAALTLLHGVLEEDWLAHESLRAMVLQAAKQARIEVLGLMALRSVLEPEQAQAQRERLRTASMDDKRLRMAELVGIVDTYEDEKAVARLVALSYEAIFENTIPSFRATLVTRMLRELKERSSIEKHQRWKLVLDPLVQQNRGSPLALAPVAKMVLGLPMEDAEPYLLFYLDAIPEPEEDVIASLAAHGTRRAIPALYPFTEKTGWFGRPTRNAQAVAIAIEEIVEREGLGALQDGALTVADAGGGELSLARAAPGALTLQEGAGHEMVVLPGSPSPGRRLVIMSVVVLVMTGIAVLGWVLAMP